MLDDLRNSAASSFENEEQAPSGEQYSSRRGSSDSLFLGMTAPQRFVIALMLLFFVCIMGSACLLIFGKIGIPYF
ncbi:MAG TPA: hypothetical protein VN376_01465 [Longilinea sp.]|nr:hypothetical protein [Longilinea sp.]